MKKFLLSLLIVFVLFGSFGCAKKEKKQSKIDVTDDVAVFDNQTVNDIEFKDSVIVYEDGKSTLTISLVNKSDKAIFIDTINIKIYDANDKLVQEFNSGFGSQIKPGGTVPIVQQVMKDISKTTKIEYKINS